jgi:hypothetical protein
MSFQDSNQQPFAPPPQQPGQSWGQQQQAAQQQGAWGSQPQQPPTQPQDAGSGAWGSQPQQQQMPQQPGYGFGQQSGAGQSFGQPQDYAQQSFPQQGYASQGYATGQPGYPPQQSDFGSGGYGYPAPAQRNSGLATTALWLGILGGWGLINLVISIIAINETGPGKKLGRGKAITGLCLTLAWSVVGIGIALAVSHHASDIATAAAPASTSIVATSTEGAGAGSSPQPSSTDDAGLSATGASDDPGCQAAQAAFNTYNKNVATDGLGAITTLGHSLENAAGQSKVAGSQLDKVGKDFIKLTSDPTDSSGMVDDLVALDTACGMTFTPSAG